MRTIQLSVEGEICKRVVARQLKPNGDPNLKSDGTIPATLKGWVGWKHGGGIPGPFEVKFFENEIQKWPFQAAPDSGTEAAGDAALLLLPDGLVKGLRLVTSASNNNQEWKYVASVPGSTTIEELDPMIIIRGGNRFSAMAFAAIGGARSRRNPYTSGVLGQVILSV